MAGGPAPAARVKTILPQKDLAARTGLEHQLLHFNQVVGRVNVKLEVVVVAKTMADESTHTTNVLVECTLRLVLCVFVVAHPEKVLEYHQVVLT